MHHEDGYEGHTAAIDALNLAPMSFRASHPEPGEEGLINGKFAAKYTQHLHGDCIPLQAKEETEKINQPSSY